VVSRVGLDKYVSQLVFIASFHLAYLCLITWSQGERLVAGERFSDFVGLDSFRSIILHLQKSYSVEYGEMIKIVSRRKSVEEDEDSLFHYYFPRVCLKLSGKSLRSLMWIYTNKYFFSMKN
jgi:hypothetical protein